MSISPLNITAAGDSGSYSASTQAATTTKRDPVVSTVAPVVTQEAQQSSDSDLVYVIGKLNDFASQNAAALNFSKDEDTGKTIVKVIDTATDTLIRQIPSEETIAIAKSIEKMRGLLINDKT